MSGTTWLRLAGIVLAQQEQQDQFFESITRTLRTGARVSTIVPLVIGVAALLAVLALSQYYSRRRERGAVRQEINLLPRAMAALGLNKRERADVRYMVERRASGGDPTTVLMAPEIFAAAAQHALAAGDSPRRGRLDALSQKLFDQPLPQPGAAPSAGTRG